MTPDKEDILDIADDNNPYDLGEFTVTKKAALEAMDKYVLELLEGKFVMSKRKFDIGMWTMWAIGVALGIIIGHSI